MTGFLPVEPFFAYTVNGSPLQTTSLPNGQTQASLTGTGAQLIEVFGTDGVLAVRCTFLIALIGKYHEGGELGIFFCLSVTLMYDFSRHFDG